MKAPKFWATRGLAATRLSPLGWITGRLTARRVRKPGFVPGIKVICVGNAGVGGAGKTTVVLDLLARLPGQTFALTRGYGGKLAGPVWSTNPCIPQRKSAMRPCCWPHRPGRRGA